MWDLRPSDEIELEICKVEAQFLGDREDFQFGFGKQHFDSKRFVSEEGERLRYSRFTAENLICKIVICNSIGRV